MVKQTAGHDALGEFAPEFAHLNDDVLFGEVWSREGKLSLKMRSVVTISALIGKGITDSSLKYHLDTARKNGVTKTEMAEILTHIAFYAGWPNAWAAFNMAKEVYADETSEFRVEDAGELGGEACGSGNAVVEDAKIGASAKVGMGVVGIGAVDGASGADAATNGEAAQHGGFFGLGKPNDGFAQYFIGQSYLNPVSDPNGYLPIFNVTFEPGCRNNWHIHHASKGGGQVLVCVDGEGWYQEEGKPARSLKPGDVVEIPANTKHWHGAKRDSWFSHLAFEYPGENASNEWCEPVTDAEYNVL